MPIIIDRYQPIFNWRWDVNTLAWVVWDGATTGGGGGGGTVAQGAAGASAWPVSGTFFQATQPVSLATAPTTPVTGTFFQATQPVSLATLPALTAGTASIGTIVPVTANRSDTYTTTGNGVTVTTSSNPFNTYALQVVGTGAAATTWDVRLEGSLDNVNFTQILQHTNATLNGVVVFSGTLLAPALYIRSRCAGLTLGPATNIIAYLVGVQ